jgi:hypothetical protein
MMRRTVAARTPTGSPCCAAPSEAGSRKADDDGVVAGKRQIDADHHQKATTSGEN